VNALVPPHPGASTPAVAARMSGFPRRDTTPELALRRLLHASGRRYRVNYQVPTRHRRTIDIAFTRSHVAVFVDGCFWHGCPQHGVLPSSNRAWWDRKIQVTKARDRETTDILLQAGWLVLRFWEHEPADKMAATVVETLATAHSQSHGARQTTGRQSH
jgi:DNA mismatch endonuclease, patch repair protein